MPDLPQWLQTLIYGITGVGVGGYAVHRKLKQDSNGDAVDGKTQKLIDGLTSQLDKERGHSERLGVVIDRLSTERNEAVKALGELNGQIRFMGHQIERLQGEIQKQEKLNADLNDTVSELRDEVMSMSKRLHTGSQS